MPGIAVGTRDKAERDILCSLVVYVPSGERGNKANYREWYKGIKFKIKREMETQIMYDSTYMKYLGWTNPKKLRWTRAYQRLGKWKNGEALPNRYEYSVWDRWKCFEGG